ncbi:hypothetical protein DACRYDRAFT_110914 [Dacryopinax primogenitus]|uniref:Arabinogalactan endo-beta-1,4-galactanase n=1 Tax=Dacryopinax primogenitus (strain DJM 731) TaxID=1858805 RepID=M5G3Y4_DACPD|nr:uncharacterized protein DACRYDRAFT_110914 [Dacryopinax primogenitus]EJT98472.1 hypothetical protein DACRYDRAFT_110914 [Dacryopinax primogenitus]
MSVKEYIKQYGKEPTSWDEERLKKLEATELPRGYIVPRGGLGSLDAQGQVQLAKEVQEWLESRVAHYKQLRGGVVCIDAIPKRPVFRGRSSARFCAIELEKRSQFSVPSFSGIQEGHLILVEQAGVTYKDVIGVPGKFESIVSRHGMNAVRVRVWTASTYNITYALEMEKRIKEAGLTLMVDLHYSDNWADPGKQYQPVAWGTTVPELTVNIYNYTRDVVLAFAAQGTPIDVLQTGNEINSGLLWPTGENTTPQGWANVATYLHAAREGARAARFGGKVMIHLANGWDQPGATWWWSNALAQGTYDLNGVDLMGFSFYPFYGTSATYANLSLSLNTIANTYDKPILVAETDYPATPWNGTALSQEFPNTPKGQEDWVSGIVNVLDSLPRGLGQGILYWEPGWVGPASLGSSCADNLVFVETGNARTSVNIFDIMRA